MLMILLAFFGGCLPPLVLLYLREQAADKRQSEWMRIFSVHSLQIPSQSMDGEVEKPVPQKKPDLRKRIHVPLPVPAFLRTRQVKPNA